MKRRFRDAARPDYPRVSIRTLTKKLLRARAEARRLRRKVKALEAQVKELEAMCKMQKMDNTINALFGRGGL